MASISSLYRETCSGYSPSFEIALHLHRALFLCLNMNASCIKKRMLSVCVSKLELLLKTMDKA